MLHPDVALHFVSEEIGHGVFATRPIPRGTITWAQDAFDLVYTPEQVRHLSGRHRAILEKYGFIDPAGDYVLCWDFGRYMNHSCTPTTCTAGSTFDVALVDIPAGGELTYDYRSLHITSPFECRCGTSRCTGVVYPDPDWDRRPDW